MDRRTATLVATAIVALVALAPSGAAQSNPDRSPVDPAVVDAFVAWWREATCDYAPQSDCGIGTAFKDAIGLVALGIDPAAWPAASDNLLAWIMAHPDAWDNATGLGPGPSLAMAALALEVNHDISSVSLADGTTRDLGAEIAAAADATGAYGSVNADAWAAFGLNVAGGHESSLRSTLDAIAEAQDDSGGWGWAVGQPPDPDTTAWALNALALGDRHADAKERAVDYLDGLQIQDGPGRACWPGYDGNASAATTSVVIPALVVADIDPVDRSVDGRTPWDCIVSFQEADGSFATAFEAYQTARGLGGAPLGIALADRATPDTPAEQPPRTTLTPAVGPLGVLAALAALVLWRRRD